MRHRQRTGRSSRRWLASQVRELALPAPFTVARFQAWLEQHSQRRVRLVAASMESGGPSGALLRRGEADYLYYEAQTSPFHQAHIVLCLTARLLLGEGAGMPVDPRLVADLSPRVIRLMLGDPASSMLTHAEAERFAFLVLTQARPGFSPAAARHAIGQLRPLHTGLLQAAPGVAGTGAGGRREPARVRLYRQVIEIRDAALALRPYRDPQAAGTAARAAGLAGQDVAAAVEAAVLASAVRARIGGHPARRTACATGPAGGYDLHGETGWLVKVAHAWTQLGQPAGPVPDRSPENRAEGYDPSAGPPPSRLR